MTVNGSKRNPFTEEFDMIREKLKRPKEEAEEEEELEIGKLFMGLMEGYKDSVIPDLSELESLGGMENCEKGSSSSGKRARIEALENEFLQKERIRRDKMAENFPLLQSMVPSLVSNPKASREKIVTETITYIRSLEKEAERLEELKRSTLLQKQIGTKPALSGCTKYLKPSVTATVLNDIAFFGVQLIVKRSSLCKIFEIFHKYHAEVFEVTVFVTDHRMLTLTGTFTLGSDGSNVVEKIKKEILDL